MSHSNYKRHKQMPKFSKLQRNCPTGKLRYKDVQMAKAVLRRIGVAAARDLELTGTTARLEKRHYDCHLCHGVHLTSKDEFEYWSMKVAA